MYLFKFYKAYLEFSSYGLSIPQEKFFSNVYLLYSKLKTIFRAEDMIYKSIREFVLKEIKDYSNVEFLNLFFESNQVVEAKPKGRAVDKAC